MGAGLSAAAGEAPFTDLPAALVEEVLGETTAVARGLLTSLEEVTQERDKLRGQLVQSDLIVTDSSLGYPPLPTTCAADGSYAIERLLTNDLAAATAVAVEGLTPPSEKRYWERPHHETFVAAEPHDEDTATVLRAVMLGEELRLVKAAPHDLVMLDGTFTLPIIYFNQAFGKASQSGNLSCSQRLLEEGVTYLGAYLEILEARRSDKHYVALPKYSTRREIGRRLRWPKSFDDRGILTMLLNAGELTQPQPFDHPLDGQGEASWHLRVPGVPEASKRLASGLADRIVSALRPLRVFYYKPQQWLPAMRIEVAANVASNPYRLATVVQGIKHQTATPSMLEPYPIYLADRTATALARALPAFRQVTTQRLSERYEGDVGEVFFAMHGYRSESGR